MGGWTKNLKQRGKQTAVDKNDNNVDSDCIRGGNDQMREMNVCDCNSDENDADDVS